MIASLTRIKNHIRKGELGQLFIDELGWDRHTLRIPVAVAGQDFVLQSVAQKRGFQILECHADRDDGIPLAAIRHKIGRQAAKSAHEHLIVFTNADRSTQIWQCPDRIKGTRGSIPGPLPTVVMVWEISVGLLNGDEFLGLVHRSVVSSRRFHIRAAESDDRPAGW